MWSHWLLSIIIKSFINLVKQKSAVLRYFPENSIKLMLYFLNKLFYVLGFRVNYQPIATVFLEFAQSAVNFMHYTFKKMQ